MGFHKTEIAKNEKYFLFYIFIWRDIEILYNTRMDFFYVKKPKTYLTHYNFNRKRVNEVSFC